MVAFKSSRRQPFSRGEARPGNLESLVRVDAHSLRTAFQASGSRRAIRGFQTWHDNLGQIVRVQIGPWRVLHATSRRRLAEIRELDGERIAVRIDCWPGGGRAMHQLWQVYDRSGRLDAALQTSCDGRLAIVTNYQTRQTCRLVRSDDGELKTAETWNF